jgi:hypothetical protein
MIDWTKQHNGVHQASYDQMIELMPDIKAIIDTFPDNPYDFIWDVKVHMLMPNQYPCIPNWHFDNIPRVNNVQDFNLVRLDLPMYLWVSNAPLTEFRKDDKTWFIEPQTWTRFTQADEHRGTMSTAFQWRGFIRATHKDIMVQNKVNSNPFRRHSQVYLDVNNFTW